MVYYFSMTDTREKAPLSVFLAATAVIFVLTLSAADSVGFVPYYVDGTEPTRSLALNDLPELGEEVPFGTVIESEVHTDYESGVAVAPTRIRINAIGLDLAVSNPNTRDLEELDEVLKDGPARYVDSALLGETGNVLIFGHSSHLPVVHNQMYKAFNKIPDLEEGNVIAIEGGGKEFLYTVISVTKVDAEEGIIDLSKKGKKLTIVTCDTLTGKSSRYVLEAEFVGSYDL
jgi:LPXTG-site transpeptidase (sortase) family protein